MKKKMKKLMLSKETVRRLVEVDLVKVAGGYTADSPTYGSCGARFCVDEPLEPSC